MKIKRVLVLLLTFVLVAGMLLTSFTGCGGSDDDGDDGATQGGGNEGGGNEGGGNEGGGNNQGGGNTPAPTKYTVTYNGTSMASSSVTAGAMLQKPQDPSKADHLFVGWYTDSGYTTKAIFPFAVNSDTTLYAKFYSYETAFEKARANTIGSNVSGYEYDYNFRLSVTFKGVGLSGNSEGNAKYNKNSAVSYYDVQSNSGVLFYDSTEYIIRRDNYLQKISLNEDGKMTEFESENITTDYTVDTSSFAKALFEYSDEDLKDITKTAKPNEYKLNTTFNASKAISTLGNAINHPIIEKFTGALPDTSVSTAMYVTFESDTIKTYRYEMIINVTDLQLSLVYDLTFKNQGTAPEIVTRTFNGVSLTPAEIAASKAEIMGYFDDFKGAERSSYDYEFNSGVDYGMTTGEINATFEGSTLRKVTTSKLYFHNDIEIDSDYKNGDLYEDAGIDDVHIKKTMLADGSVHMIEKKTFFDDTYEIENYTPSDDDSFYLFDAINNIGAYSFVEKDVDSTTTTYFIGVSNSGINTLLNWFEAKLDLDPLGNASEDVKIFGTYDANSISIEKAEIIVVVENGALLSIEIDIEGSYSTKFDNSRDFTTADIAAFDLTLEIEITDDAVDFEPFEDVDDAK